MSFAGRRRVLVGPALALALTACTVHVADTTTATTSPTSAPTSAVGSTVVDPDITGFTNGLPTDQPTGSRSDASPPACSDGPPCYVSPRNTGVITGDVVPEASGIAASSTDPDLFFVVDDDAKGRLLAAVRTDGSLVGTIAIDGLPAAHTEALANGVCSAGDPAQCLYIGDIGDDGVTPRTTVSLYRVPQPDAAALPTDLTPDRFDYAYPDGGYNAESLLIADDASIVIVTRAQKDQPSRVYRGPAGGGDLEFVAEFTPPKPTAPAQSLLVGNVVTDASRLPDRVILLGYDQAVEYLAPQPGADPAGFLQWPYRQVEIPEQWQSEGITYRGAAGLSACGFVVVSEKALMTDPQIGVVDCA